jgi:hypothetical protein
VVARDRIDHPLAFTHRANDSLFPSLAT